MAGELELAVAGKLDNEGDVLRYKSSTIVGDTAAQVVIDGGGALLANTFVHIYYDAATNTWPSAAAYSATQRIMWVATEAGAAAPAAGGRPGRTDLDIVMLLA